MKRRIPVSKKPRRKRPQDVYECERRSPPWARCPDFLMVPRRVNDLVPFDADDIIDLGDTKAVVVSARYVREQREAGRLFNATCFEVFERRTVEVAFGDFERATYVRESMVAREIEERDRNGRLSAIRRMPA